MFNILNPLESADGNRPTIGVGLREIGPVGTGLKGKSLNCSLVCKHNTMFSISIREIIILAIYGTVHALPIVTVASDLY